ncbi:hypothetical protein NQ318_022269 [Aromia moschata]|uniref:Uncharacterized protein n=1 Tax=Aromia moschata TaxID=1265417 RepID=A0AAV8Z701_9CUCU|nr:hypothetical protein NQ318_022269 [Aromia moschata]
MSPYRRMPMMPPHMSGMMQGQGGPAKPLFPSAIPTSSPGGPSAPRSWGRFQANFFSSGSSDASKVSTIATTGASSKIIHPSEDISLEEIRAKHPKYARSIPSKSDDGPSTGDSGVGRPAGRRPPTEAGGGDESARGDDAEVPGARDRPPISMTMGGPIMAPMRHQMIPGPPTLLGGHLMRPPPISMPPGMIGMPPGMVYGAPMFPTGPVLMQPRYR